MLLESCSPWKIILRPLSLLYGLGVALRNKAFDYGILPERSYPIPIICVGNISVGGTGKTPHVDYILSLLTAQYRVAVLSRGYKRKTKGLVLGTADSTSEEIGDEPKQLLLKHPTIQLVVDGNRRRAMNYLMSLPEGERPHVVVMDDGLQHRYVKPSYRIMLMSADRPIDEDRLLPEGLLREPSSALYRMDCVIVTKCSPSLKPIERRGIERTLSAYSYQQVFFSSLSYRALRSIYHLMGVHEGERALPPLGSPVLIVSGIARPQDFAKYMAEHYRVLDELHYSDHHNFTRGDLSHIVERYEELRREAPELHLVCTEKDAVRLTERLGEFPSELAERLYYQPIEVEVLYRREELDRLIHLAAKAKPRSLQELR